MTDIYLLGIWLILELALLALASVGRSGHWSALAFFIALCIGISMMVELSSDWTITGLPSGSVTLDDYGITVIGLGLVFSPLVLFLRAVFYD